ncbi:MAG: aminotransferase DegT [Crocinitomicaceae bacterium]|nr:aminotransferase DegT [Crocinitomicaceae bacterium]|tara:strand:+ start:418 stop:1575 length:1158 start_codon:yes stop_codon:yes gene_type:complete
MSSNSFIPLSVPNLSGNEWKYAEDAIKTGWVSSVGSYVDEFEQKFAEYVGVKRAVAVVNGTAALHISLMLAGVEAGDEVIVPDLTFVAPANAITYCNANPVFLGSDWETLGLNPAILKSFLEERCELKDGYTYNKTTGKRISAIIPMHTFGNPVDMDPLIELCKAANIAVVEDATESLGSSYKGSKTGTFGMLGCFSFNGNKIMTTGGGGMIVTNDEDLANKAKHLSTTAKSDPIEYDHDAIGYNYRLVNVLAAIGVGQLEQMDEFVATKRRNYNHYIQSLSSVEGMNMFEKQDHSESNYWMYPLILDRITPMDLTKALGEKRIQARPVWKLMHTLPMFKDCETFGIETSEEIYNKVLCIPCSTDLSEEDVNRVCESLKEIANNE